MDMQDREDLLKHILGEIKKTDEFVISFKNELAVQLYPVITEHLPTVGPTKAIAALLDNYATTVINYTESVVDKDRNYPTYRLADELAVMRGLVNKHGINSPMVTLKDALVDAVKTMMIKSNPNIMNLSGDGFRLLSANVEHYAWEMIEAIKKELIDK